MTAGRHPATRKEAATVLCTFNAWLTSFAESRS